MVLSASKAMAIVCWDANVTSYFDYFRKGRKIISEYPLILLNRFKYNLKKKHRMCRKKLFSHQYDARLYTWISYNCVRNIKEIWDILYGAQRSLPWEVQPFYQKTCVSIKRPFDYWPSLKYFISWIIFSKLSTISMTFQLLQPITLIFTMKLIHK